MPNGHDPNKPPPNPDSNPIPNPNPGSGTTPGNGSGGKVTPKGEGDRPPQFRLAAAAGVGGLIGGLVGALIGCCLHH